MNNNENEEQINNSENFYKDVFSFQKQVHEENKQSEVDAHIMNLMYRRYDEDERKNNHLDNKNINLFSFTGIIFTLQSTVFIQGCIHLLNGAEISYKIIVSLIFLISSVCYGLAIYYFLDSVKIQNFMAAPNHDELVDYWKSKESFDGVNEKVVGTMRNAININNDVVNFKANNSEKGLTSLKLGILFLLVLLVCFISYFIFG